MYKYILAFIASVVLGWFAVGVAVTDPNDENTAQQSAPRNISLLGQNSSDQTVVDTIDIDSLSSVNTLVASIHSMSPEELRRQLISLAKSPRASRQAMELMVAQLASLDPERTFTFLRERENLFRGLLGTALAEWAQSDLPAALEASIAVVPRGGLLADFVSKLGGAECEKVYRSLLEMNFDKEAPGFVANIVSNLVQNNPSMAAESALDLVQNHRFEAEHGLDNVMFAWYKKDPEAVIQWIETLDDLSSYNLALKSLGSVSLGAGIEGFDRVWDLLDEAQRNSVAESVNSYVDELDIKAMLDWVDTKIESPIHHQKILSSLLGSRRLSEEPEKLEEILSHWEGEFDGRELPDQIKRISQRWAEKNMESFEVWMNSVKDPQIRTATQNGLLEYWMGEDPDKAIAYWEQHHGDVEGESDRGPSDFEFSGRSGIGNLVKHLVEEAGQADLRSLTERLPAAWHDDAIEAYVLSYGEDAPGESLRYLETLPEGGRRNHALQRLLGLWASQEPDEAAEWVSALAESEQREIAARDLANNWARTDPEAAIAWLESEPASASRDKAAAQIVEVASEFYPERALSLAKGIADQEVRERLLEETVSNLARRDPELAEEYVESAELGDRWNESLERERALQESFQNASEP